MKYDVCIIGGGASGLFAGAVLGEAGLKTLILEPNRELGRKLRITGKGRCNLTNDCTAQEVMKNVPRNPKFLYSALSKLPPERIISWFEARGLKLVTERGRRVFPQSGRADDVADLLSEICIKTGATVVREKAADIIAENGAAVGVKTKSGEYFAESVILATGGKSYPRTGSDGSGYKIAERLGHTVKPQSPSLVPIETVENVSEMSGLTLKNVVLTLFEDGRKKPVYSEFGELTFMPYGISGPLGLTASCLMEPEKIACKAYKLVIDLKPALTPDQLDARLLREIKSDPKADFSALLRGILPRELCRFAAEAVNIPETAQISGLTREQRLKIAAFLKGFSLTPKSLRPFDEAIITRGGIAVGEIDPASMESRFVKRLYFTGEIIDCDAFTGGYNLTVAFATAYSAAENIIQRKEEKTWD